LDMIKCIVVDKWWIFFVDLGRSRLSHSLSLLLTFYIFPTSLSPPLSPPLSQSHSLFLLPYSSNLKVLAIATMVSPPSAFVAPGRLQVPDDIGGVIRKLTLVI
jgi:hypothetical protein